ncbi:hypothetical protein CDO28_01590 [Sinorhizobium meliloti]|uniref:hypothetical protein n=1 Tax=Rhizobium meliloti TaxID=382 RepID=UPI000B499FC4|nr:hypothetical protein [Sinorhizobium meliloti]ASP70378.1 hypothetical protein CDO28_01590 [Sinorhizobium meliloti]MDE3854814.1 hypothetical protein [Sinorhizobium meliloti]MQW52491.1 hypothetical protein [Sinorhizobium meliloti]
MTKPIRLPVKQTDGLTALAHIEQGYKTVRTLIKCAAAVGCIYFVTEAIAPLAGKSTAVTIALNLLADIKFAASLTLAGAAVAWAVVERSLRQRKTQYLQDRVISLETTVDPKRSSSGLTRTGKTHPNDRSA